MYSDHFKNSLCQSSCLIKNNIFCLGQCLEIIGSFHQNSLMACPADSCEKAKWDADNQRARTADYKKCQCSVDPVIPLRCSSHCKYSHKWWKHCKCKCAIAYRRCIIFCKFRNKVLWSWFSGCRFFYQFQYLGYRWFSELFCCTDLQHTCQIDTATDDLITCLRFSWNAFACQCTCIQCGCTCYNHTINRHFLSRLDNDHCSDLNFIRIHLLKLSILLYVCIIRTDIHQFTDIPTALSNCIALEKFTDLIKQHNSNRFIKVSGLLIKCNRNRTDRSNCHQEILIKYLPV